MIHCFIFPFFVSRPSPPTERTIIDLGSIISLCICKCHNFKRKLTSKKNRPICGCLTEKANDDNEEEINSSHFDLSKLHKLSSSSTSFPFVIKVFYAISAGNVKAPSPEDALKLSYITLSSHGSDSIGHFEHQDVEGGHNVALLACVATKLKLAVESKFGHTNLRSFYSLFGLSFVEFDRPRRLLFFVNPVGGAKRAQKIFDKEITPLLKLSTTKFTVVTTERANHAKDLIMDPNIDLSQFDGIIGVGGDGMFSEILNGILMRTQSENSIDYECSDSLLAKPQIKLGIIPAGSTDAVVYATNGCKDPQNSLLSILLGRSVSIDVGAVHQRSNNKLLRYSATFMGYGFFGDTVLESEKNRWLGPSRYAWAGLKKLFQHKIYDGEIKLCIEPGDGSPKDDNPCTVE